MRIIVGCFYGGLTPDGSFFIFLFRQIVGVRAGPQLMAQSQPQPGYS